MRVAAALIALALSACMAMPSRVLVPTPSGRAECMVPGVEPSAVIDHCAAILAERGWAVHSRSDAELIVRKKESDALFDFYPTKEIQLAFLARDGGTHVIGQRSVVSRVGTPHEKRSDTTNGQADYDLWADVLRDLPEHFAVTATASN